MSKLKDLHAFLHSLNKAEKRALRMALPNQAASQQMQLLDHLLAAREFEEQVLLEKLERKGLLKPLPTLLQRLRKRLVQNEANFSAKRSVDAELRSAMAEIEFLFRKKLLDQIPAALRKARKRARRFSRFAQELRFIEWERRLLLEVHPKHFRDALQTLREEELEALAALSLQKEAANLHFQMRILSREILRPRTDAEKAPFLQILNHPALPIALRSDCFLTKAYARHTVGLNQLSMQEPGKAAATYKELMDQWKSAPEWIHEQTNLFLASFNNFQLAYMVSPLEDYRLPDAYARFFAAQRFDEPHSRLRFQQIFFGNELVIHLNFARFEEGQTLCEEIKVWLSKHEDQHSQATWLTFKYNLATFHFLAGQASSANAQVQAILNLPDGNQRRDIRDFAPLFELVLHHELDNQDLIEYRLRSVRRYFDDPERETALSKALLEFFRIEKDGDEKEKMKNLGEALEKIEGQMLGLEELRLWVRSKLTGRSITEVFRERVGLE